MLLQDFTTHCNFSKGDFLVSISSSSVSIDVIVKFLPCLAL